MKRFLLLALVLGAVFPVALFGQSPYPSLISPCLPALPSAGEDSSEGSFLSDLPLLKGLKLGKILLNPSVQIGYQHIGTNMSIPVEADRDTPVGQLQIGTIDVALQDFNFWSGTVGLSVAAGPLNLFGSVGGFLPRLYKFTGLIPISLGQIGAEPVIEMTGSKFQFWTAQCGAGYTICGGFSILGGFMWTHTEAELSDPRRDGIPLRNQTLRGDVLMNTWVPFLGIQFLQQGIYRAALLYSPLATSSGAMDLRTSTPLLSDLRYSLNQPGNFLALNAEYYFPLPSPVMFSIWFNGSYLNIRGHSDLEFTTAGPAVFRTKDVTITNTQYLYGGGITFALIF